MRPVDLEASTPCSAPFDGDDWVFSIDWDGSRCLIVTDGSGTVRLQGLAGSLTARFPEIAAAAAALRSPTVLDGYVCLLDPLGRPDLPGLSLRAAGGHRRPAVFLATDLLFAEGGTLLGRPLSERLARLSGVVPGDSRIQMTDCVEGHGIALAAAAAEQGLSAMVARRRGALYHPGMASPDRLRVELAGHLDAVVVGVRRTAHALQAVLAQWAGGRLTFTGLADIADPVTRRWFAEVSAAAREPAMTEPRLAGPGVDWIRPRLTATVTAGAAPAWPQFRLVALRDDIDPRWCVRRAAIPAPAMTASAPLRPFSPTVLRALPLDAA